MGTDKAFLDYHGKPFIRAITDEMLTISEDIVVLVGNKVVSQFTTTLNAGVKILNDAYSIQNPMGGILSVCDHVSNKYSAFLGCDTPMMKAKVIRHLFDKAFGHSAAVPIWNNKNAEPLCAVCNASETRVAGEKL
ncbi:MAG: NTP transferase domain-containing protein [Nitrososphaerota archaeon]|nr:NTP transferase domain-containing protein [Nitrososphaerota archaeon]